jgi:ABC-type uncharacterized transport system involved in gliding motility auxiliary subunit
MQRTLGILSYVGMALVFGALAIRIFRPDWDQYAVYASWAGLALVVLYTLGQWREIVAYFRRRNARYGAIASASVLIVLGILVAVNYLSTRQNKRWDLTANRQYSVSDQTVRLLQALDSPVRFLVFDQEAGFDRFRSRLTEYEYHSNNVEVEYIDADRRPVQAREYEIQTYGTVVVEYMGRRERVTSDAEQDLTNALIKVLNPQEKRVYFLAGHGEKDPVDTERTGYSAITEALRRDNYEWETLILAQTNAIPENATVIVIAGPRTDLLEAEVELLRQYLADAGKLLVLMDPPENFAQPARLARLAGLLEEWGIAVTESVVVDVSGLTSVATVPVAAPPYPFHPITERFDLITMFPVARAVSPAAEAPPDRAAQSFVQTTARAWAETNLTTIENPDTLAPEPEAGDTPGPVSMAAAVSVPAATETPAAGSEAGDDPDATEEDDEEGGEQRMPETRVAAIGDSDFIANAYLGVEGNGDLFMNTVNWLAQQESLIAIRPREAADRRLTMTANHVTGLFWMSIVLVPALVLGAGVYSWWRRR